MPAYVVKDGPLFGVPDVIPDLPPGCTLIPDPKEFLMIIQYGTGSVFYVNKDGAIPHEKAMPPLQVIEPPPWTIRIGSSPDAPHELHFRQEPMSSLRGARGRDLLIQLAVMLNARGISPREFNEIHQDAQRIDWLERECFDFVWDDVRPGVTRASDGRQFFGSTRREAIDAALNDEKV